MTQDNGQPDDGLDAPRRTPEESAQRAADTAAAAADWDKAFDDHSAPVPAAPAAPAPTQAEDDALREERARRFGPPGRTVPSPSTPAPDAEPTIALPAPRVQEMPAEPVATVATAAMPVAVATPVQPPAPAPAQAEDPFAGFEEDSGSRAASHWWVILTTLIFAPVAWYLATDGMERLAFSIGKQGVTNPAGFFSLGGGLLAAFIVLLAARWSSVGPIIVGSITTAAGVAFLVRPAQGLEILTSWAPHFNKLGQFGQNVMDYLQADLTSGRFLLYGVTLIMCGVISHGARRQGRREERRRAALERED